MEAIQTHPADTSTQQPRGTFVEDYGARAARLMEVLERSWKVKQHLGELLEHLDNVEYKRYQGSDAGARLDAEHRDSRRCVRTVCRSARAAASPTQIKMVSNTDNMTTVDDNQAFEEDAADYPFTYNFIDTPWDDRSKNSKIGIISLLVAIIAVIVVCVSHCLIMHYASGSVPTYIVENTCPIINLNEIEHYSFVAKVYSMSSKELLCVGAVLSDDAVLADEICARDGPVILVVGSSRNPRCKKGHAVDEIIEVDHEGMLSQKLIILKSKGNFAECRSTISIGSELQWRTAAHVIGRPLTHSRSLITKQPVVVFGRGNCSIPSALGQKLNRKMVICVKDFGRCQVQAGDLLTQRGRLYGLASTGVHRSVGTAAYFADLNAIKESLAPFEESSM